MADVVSATPDSAEQQHVYKFNVSMSCGGCSGAVDRVLKKLDGMYMSSSMSPCWTVNFSKAFLPFSPKSNLDYFPQIPQLRIVLTLWFSHHRCQGIQSLPRGPDRRRDR